MIHVHPTSRALAQLLTYSCSAEVYIPTQSDTKRHDLQKNSVNPYFNLQPCADVPSRSDTLKHVLQKNGSPGVYISTHCDTLKHDNCLRTLLHDWNDETKKQEKRDLQTGEDPFCGWLESRETQSDTIACVKDLGFASPALFHPKTLRFSN